jgi:hypothetical protein
LHYSDQIGRASRELRIYERCWSSSPLEMNRIAQCLRRISREEIVLALNQAGPTFRPILQHHFVVARWLEVWKCPDLVVSIVIESVNSLLDMTIGKVERHFLRSAWVNWLVWTRGCSSVLGSGYGKCCLGISPVLFRWSGVSNFGASKVMPLIRFIVSNPPIALIALFSKSNASKMPFLILFEVHCAFACCRYK